MTAMLAAMDHERRRDHSEEVGVEGLRYYVRRVRRSHFETRRRRCNI